MFIEYRVETIVTTKCDSSWGNNKCPNNADFIVTHNNSVMYAIMCKVHKEDFEEELGDSITNFTFHPYSIELNTDLKNKADLANEKETK